MECSRYAQNLPGDSCPGNPATLAYTEINLTESGAEGRPCGQALLYSLAGVGTEDTMYTMINHLAADQQGSYTSIVKQENFIAVINKVCITRATPAP